MKKKIYREQLEWALDKIKKLERKHPKAEVFYDVDYCGIQIVYPLPKDPRKIMLKENDEESNL